MRANPAEEMRWCSLGCGAEVTAEQLTDEGKCPRCGGNVVDYGWRYRDGKGVFEYASSWDTLPADVRKATA